MAQAGRRQRRVRRPALRGVDRKGRLRDPEPLRRRDPGDPRPRGRDRAGRHTAGPHRGTRLHTPGWERRPARRRGGGGGGPPPGRSPGGPAGGGGAGPPAEAVPGTAGSGGPSLNDPAAPQMGGSEAMPALEDPGVGVPAGEVHEITMPKLGETVTEGTVGGWRKQVGDTVEFDDPLFEVSTDKVDSEIPSPYDGVLLEI